MDDDQERARNAAITHYARAVCALDDVSDIHKVLEHLGGPGGLRFDDVVKAQMRADNMLAERYDPMPEIMATMDVAYRVGLVVGRCQVERSR